MEPVSPSIPEEATVAELQELRAAIAARYTEAQGVLGSQLGSLVRKYLHNPDLKGRFGGLKSFVARHFPAEIIWRGRRGLDDLYDISFTTDEGTRKTGAWHPVSLEPAPGLWSAVTNPSVSVQFAWLAKEEKLFQAPAGAPSMPELVSIEKLTKADYQEIAVAFVNSIANLDANIRIQALETAASSLEFTKLVREKGLLAQWEEFRVDGALRLFADRLKAAGADVSAASRWREILRLSQQQARSQRMQRTASVTVTVQPTPPRYSEDVRREALDPRAVAIKAIDFLSDPEISNLSLPLGSVMRAVGSLLKRP